MKLRKFSVITVLLILLTAFQLYAFDIGGSFVSATGISTKSGFLNEEGLGFWLQSGKGEHTSFETKIDFIFSATAPGFYIYPEYLKFDSIYTDLDFGPSIMATSFGRFTTSDFSGKVFSQKLDGFTINFNYPSAELTLTAGYTGLFLADTGSAITTAPSTVMSRTDARENNNAVSLLSLIADPDASGKPVFQSPRAVEIITFTLPQIALKQNVTLSFVAQEDMRPMFDVIGGYSSTTDNPYEDILLKEGESVYYPDRGGAVDTQYIGAGLAGSTVDSLYHNIYYYFGTGRAMSYKTDASSSTGYSYSYDTIVSHLAGFSFDYYMSWFMNSKAGLAFSFATGDSDATTYFEGNSEADYNQFLPITNGGGGLIFSPGVANIISANINFSLKPFEKLDLPYIGNAQFVINAIPFFRAVNGPIYVSGINSDYSGNYLGSEIDLTVNLRPFSDLGVIAQLGYFIPDTEAFTTADHVFSAKLNASLSF